MTRPPAMNIPRALILLLLFSSLVRAETWKGAAEIRFEGTSTLHDWGGKVEAEPFAAEVGLEQGKPATVQSKVTVKAAKMDTAEAKRDENMRKAMKAADHPEIEAVISAKFDEIAPGEKPQTLPMTLTLLGKPQQVTGTISNWKLAGNQASFDLDFDLSLKKSGIMVPAVLLFIKVGDKIQVHTTVRLTRS